MHGENISSVSSKIRKNCNFFCLLQICPNQQWNFEFKLFSFKLQRKQMIDDDLKNTYNALTSLFKSTVQTTFFAPGFKYTFLILLLLLDLATPTSISLSQKPPPSKYNLKKSKFLSEKNMPRRGVFWSRPVTRAYTYNLNVGENYYAPLTDYLDSTDRSQRGKNFFS